MPAVPISERCPTEVRRSGFVRDRAAGRGAVALWAVWLLLSACSVSVLPIDGSGTLAGELDDGTAFRLTERDGCLVLVLMRESSAGTGARGEASICKPPVTTNLHPDIVAAVHGVGEQVVVYGSTSRRAGRVAIAFDGDRDEITVPHGEREGFSDPVFLTVLPIAPRVQRVEAWAGSQLLQSLRPGYSGTVAER